VNIETDLHQQIVKLRNVPRYAPTLSLEPPAEWMTGAACLQYDADTWFPEGRGSPVRTPKQICKGCDVIAQCLAYALANNEHFGIWGGKSERERRSLRRRGAA
jgi:WhiB family redox-sensing transcriptional regulator